MKKIILAMLLSFGIYLHGVCHAAPDQTVDIAVIGAGPGGLMTAYNILKNGRNPVVYATNLGGPLLRGGDADTWKAPRVSWKVHPRFQILAESLGCSAKDKDGKADKEDIKCVVEKLMKELGPKRLKDHYTLIAVNTGLHPDDPVELTFKTGDTGELKTVQANCIEFAIRRDDLERVKFTE